MVPRSWLFVPGDSERKLAKAVETGAHAVIIDLEDAVAVPAKAQARELARNWLAVHRQQLTQSRPVARWVRINAFDTDLWREDLAEVMAGAPDGVMLPKCEGPEQIRQLAAEIYEQEQRHRIAIGSTRILPLVSETARSALTIPSYIDVETPRLAGLTWGAEDLSAVLGASRKRDAKGAWTGVFSFIRAQCLLTAHARGIWAIDTLHDDFRAAAATRRAAQAARADGFSGMLAIHPSQVPIINAAFAPSEAELAEARAILDLFEQNPNAGTLQYKGRMIDQPHIRLARQLLGLG